MRKPKVYSTGVLRRQPDAVTATVNLMNFCSTEEVWVEVWDWSSYTSPQRIPVLIGDNDEVHFPFCLQPKSLAVMYAPLQGVTFYEVRVVHAGGNNLIANTFGRNVDLEAQEGNTVLDSQFITVDLDCFGQAPE
ncbi:hypothetical protein FZC84_02910 [Rossellomorea vietnamensis]|uniref:Uncharacterized protein n=1 Tax=Rossellomorea vietnamensis TaxID=218284 RepID=A0A5D4MKU5_9BACI|nr:hypothetical protein [Rossellomorea vietnamensis]TYS01611.1 hypothetical protein FZC84_02910 [Rossellomorea vietnamensis]